MDHIMIIGLLAGIFATSASVPQVLKAIKTKHTKDISLWMYIMLTTGVTLWLIYGILINDFPLIIANIATVILVGSVLGLKIKYG